MFYSFYRCKTTHKHLIVNSLLLSNVDTETVSDMDNWMKWMEKNGVFGGWKNAVV